MEEKGEIVDDIAELESCCGGLGPDGLWALFQRVVPCGALACPRVVTVAVSREGEDAGHMQSGVGGRLPDLTSQVSCTDVGIRVALR
ncbi:hypothetical protein [Streptomyces sp. NPDC001135]